MIWSLCWRKYINAVRNTTGSVATADDGDLMNHYRMFVANLEILFIKSCKKIDSSINSKEINSINSKERKCFRKLCITIWKTLWFFTTVYRRTFFGRNDHCWERTITTSCWWNTRKSNEPVRVANRDGKWHFLRWTDDIHSYTGKVVGAKV